MMMMAEYSRHTDTKSSANPPHNLTPNPITRTTTYESTLPFTLHHLYFNLLLCLIFSPYHSYVILSTKYIIPWMYRVPFLQLNYILSNHTVLPPTQPPSIPLTTHSTHRPAISHHLLHAPRSDYLRSFLAPHLPPTQFAALGQCCYPATALSTCDMSAETDRELENMNKKILYMLVNQL